MSACREYFFYGREIYTAKREMFRKGIALYNLEYLYGTKDYTAHMPDWETLAVQYCTASRYPELDLPSPFQPHVEKQNEIENNSERVESIVLQGGHIPLTTMKSNNNNNSVTHNTTASPDGQSDEQSTAGSMCITQGPVKFFDSDSGFTRVVESQPDGTYGVGSSGATDIKDFLGRPLEIASFVHSSGTSTAYTLYPWELFFQNSAIYKKISNFAYLRCTMNFKIVVNAAPTWWGMSVMSYRPLLDFSPASVTVGDDTVMSASQKAHVYINPTTSQGGCICAPFFYDKNWLDVTKLSDFHNMGELLFQYMTPHGLRCSTDPTTQSVEYKIFAWATDVELTQSTDEIALQGGEWATGPVSSVASAIANATGKLHQIPYIGPYMKATTIASTAVGKIAHIFGFSRTPIIDNISAMKQLPFGTMANCGMHEVVERLTVDPKQELCIDSRTVGLDGSDEMTIISIASRESFVKSADWEEQLSHGSILANMLVNPTCWIAHGANGYQPTALCFAAYPFSYWRGDIVFRIVIQASKFHRGRLLVQWDPLGPGSATTDVNVVASQIMDLATNRDMEFIVPYSSQYPFLKNLSGLSNYVGVRTTGVGPIIYSPLKESSNGSLTITVLNEATGLSSTNQILDVQIFVRGGDNFEVAGPRDFSTLSTPFSITTDGVTLQSGEVEPEITPSDFAPTAVESTVMIETTDSIADKMYDVCFGERITSFRTLLKRYAYSRNLIFNDGQPNLVYSRYMSTMSRWPLPRGYCTDGVDVMNVTNNGNVSNVTLFTYLQGAFVGMRGSSRWKINFVHRNTANNELAVARPKVPLTVAGYAADIGLATGVSRSLAMETLLPSFEQCGYTILNQLTQSGMEIEAPHYSRGRFITSNPYATMLGHTRSDTTTDAIMLMGTFIEATTSYDGDRECWTQHHACGDDFSFFYFNHTPVFFTYTITIT
jgi:hypothetical protein